MAERTTLGDFVLGLHGLAILRNLWIDPASIKAWAKSIAEVAVKIDEEPLSSPFHAEERTVSAGYAEWAATYDGPGNPVLLAEEPVVNNIVAGYPVGRALDAACGTGRHAAHLSSLGHEVVGVDISTEMLELASAKAPGARFEIGDLTALPLPDASVDLAVCAMSLTHLADLGPPVRELARVVRPGGHVVISDVHPQPVSLGAHASYNRSEPSGGFIRNYIHLHSHYLNAFREAGLLVERCLEPIYGDGELATLARFEVVPGLAEAAIKGTPIVLIWELVKPAP
ncbi:MAG: class I SAM-dependent methyltransferase [Chloroflexota bacterium]|nr:class I SAM-dependent methyltransferase [Chloroflexota bacterium]